MVIFQVDLKHQGLLDILLYFRANKGDLLADIYAAENGVYLHQTGLRQKSEPCQFCVKVRLIGRLLKRLLFQFRD